MDIREKESIGHDEISALNFIRNSGSRVFRKHHRQGLRSHVIEVLDAADVEKEIHGVIVDGIRWFPPAQPIRILRIFRSCFSSLSVAIAEVRRVKITETYLTRKFIAVSEEFLVEYVRGDGCDLLLCGFQEYVDGGLLNPWDPFLYEHVKGMYPENRPGQDPELLAGGSRFETFLKVVGRFVDNVKLMIFKGGHIPDLAGVGNLIATNSGNIKLVDINNISEVAMKNTIILDDRNYPACDKSIEALSILEKKLLGRKIRYDDRLYKVFLDPGRMKEVRAIDKEFHRSLSCQFE
jgi:hypothetical protein